VDVKKGETRTEHFLNNISSNGRVPVVIIPSDYVHKLLNGENSSTTSKTPTDTTSSSSNNTTNEQQSTILTESNAILTFFSDGTPLYPSNPIERAKIMQWLFWEQFSHEPNFSSLRFWITLLDKGDDPQYLDKINERQIKGYEALNFMENHLSKEDWLVANRFTIADIALYAYTHCAEEGKEKRNRFLFYFILPFSNFFFLFFLAGYSIDSFPKIKAWLRRVENMPGYVPIDD
jgi:glutathione S-transferase